MYYVCIQVLSTSKYATFQLQGETEDNGMNLFFIVLVSLGNSKSDFYIVSLYIIVDVYICLLCVLNIVVFIVWPYLFRICL